MEQNSSDSHSPHVHDTTYYKVDDTLKYELQDSPRILTWEDSPHAQDTTYYKAVPYTRIPMDTEVQNILESLEFKRQELELVNIAEKSIVQEFELRELERVKIAGHDRGPWPISTGPVLYVKSIAICNDKQGWDAFQMFGQISITDLDKNTFYFFNSGPDKLHLVSSDEWNVPFSHCPIAPVLGGKLKFSLRNPEGYSQIFKEDKEFSIYSSCKDDCQDDIHQEFPLEGGYYAKMVFNKIPRAVLVRCEMFLRYTGTDGVDKDGFYTVRGSVKINNFVCLDDSKAFRVRHGKSREFGEESRIVFPVPVGSPLKFDYNLYHDEFEFANGKCEVPPDYRCKQGGRPDEVYLTCNDENYCLCMTVQWYLHWELFISDGYTNFDVEWNDLSQKPLQWRPSDDDLVEVFSVVVGGVDSAPPVLCGRIVVRDEHGNDYIFARNKGFPDKYSPPKKQLERSVALAWPDRWLARQEFYMHLKLKDANDDLIFMGQLDSEYFDFMFDRRLCGVIKHENGFFAVVHYSVFKNGKKAKVTVKHNEDDGCYSHVYGRVFAAYDNNDDSYPSTYDKECYRSIIFNRSKQDCVTVKNGFEIPLSKTHVSTPSDCRELIIDADLWVRPNTTSSYQRDTAELRFVARRNGSQSKQLGCLAVTVDWS